MFLHLGQNKRVRLEAVEALLDRQLFERLPVNRQFLAMARAEGRLEGLPRGLAGRTVVLAGSRVVLSPLCRRTLAGRVVSWLATLAASGPRPSPLRRATTVSLPDPEPRRKPQLDGGKHQLPEP